MPDRGKGQYDAEYAQCSCFWGTSPGKFVELFLDQTLLSEGSVLDLGAGEGKNSIYLAQRGFHVTAVECSAFAIRNFRHRLETLSPTVRARITIQETDVVQADFKTDWDLVIAYGLLHCLPSMADVESVVRRMQRWTRPLGWNVVVAFTNELPVPDCQQYLEPTLLAPDSLSSLYEDWEIMALENSVLTEVHPTSKVMHTHSVCRLLARRADDRRSH